MTFLANFTMALSFSLSFRLILSRFSHVSRALRNERKVEKQPAARKYTANGRVNQLRRNVINPAQHDYYADERFKENPGEKIHYKNLS